MPTKTFKEEINELDIDELKSLLRSNYKRIDEETKQIIKSKIITKVILSYIPVITAIGVTASIINLTSKILQKTELNTKPNVNPKNHS